MPPNCHTQNVQRSYICNACILSSSHEKWLGHSLLIRRTDLALLILILLQKLPVSPTNRGRFDPSPTGKFSNKPLEIPWDIYSDEKLPQFVRAQWHARMTNLFCDPTSSKQLYICTCTGLFAFALCTNMFVENKKMGNAMIRLLKDCMGIEKKVFGLFTASSGFWHETLQFITL